MPFENRAGARRQWRVDEDRRPRHGTGLHEQVEVDQQFLRPLDGEGGNDQRAAGRGSATNDVAEHGSPLFGRNIRAVPVAIGRFADEIVDTGRTFRIGLQQLVTRSDIA